MTALFYSVLLTSDWGLLRYINSKDEIKDEPARISLTIDNNLKLCHFHGFSMKKKNESGEKLKKNMEQPIFSW